MRILLMLALLAAATASAKDDLWLRFDFDGTLEPTGGFAKDDMQVTYLRPYEMVLPGNRLLAADAPRFEEDQGRRGLWLGKVATNLLPPGLADLSAPAAGEFAPLAGAKATAAESKDALFGSGMLHVEASNLYGGGVLLKFSLPGAALPDGRLLPFLFSFHVRGSGKVELRADVAGGQAEAPKSLALDGRWQRASLWLASSNAASAEARLVNRAGFACAFQLSGLKLEKKDRAYATVGPSGMAAAYGSDFTPSAWSKGQGPSAVPTNLAERIEVKWRGPEPSFPYAEGSVTAWIRPDFHRGDAEGHGVFARYYMIHSLLFEPYGQLGYFRGEDLVDKANNFGEVRVSRPEDLETGKWGFLAATWSDKAAMTRLYFNGRLLGEHPSHGDREEQANPSLVIGGWGDPLDGLLDTLAIYSRALSADEVRALFEGKR